MVANMPPGRPGNLTPEQEAKLKEMWAQYLDFFGMSHDEVHTAQANGTLQRTPTDLSEKKKRRSILGRFSRKDKSADAEEEQSAGAAINDKHGAMKEYEEALRSMKPEDIREAFWHMSKMDHPDAILLRFLRARKWDVHAANVMALSTLHWRLKDFKVDEDVMFQGEGGAVKAETSSTGDEKKVAADFMQQYRLGKSFFHGVDNEGRPMCHVRVRLHKGGEQCTESLERYTIHTIETGRMLLRPPVDTATIIFDMTDFSLANMDYSPVKFMIKVFEANYPESLGRVIVYKAPWIFSQFWRIIRGWLDPVVASKIDFASNISELADFVPKSQIIEELGGDEDWTYKYIEPAEGENAKMEDKEGKEKVLEERKELVKEYEAETIRWINGEDRTEARNALAQKLGNNYWALDPYVRARSLYDRLNVLGPGGKVNFYPEKEKS